MSEKGADRIMQQSAERRPWTAPRVDDLPRLTELTLVTGNAIDGGMDLNGSTTVF